MKIGHGYDVHRLIAGRPLIIGGVSVKYEKGLLGHSDADVLTHAVIDAILGASGLGDIGSMFPDSEEEYKGISSMLLLEQAAVRVFGKGYRISNIDCTVVAQEPKLAPYIRDMEIALSERLGLPPERVNIKATTEEGLGFTGAREGIAAHAVCLIEEE